MFSQEQYELVNRISELKKEKNAIILSHFYQPAIIQEIADVVGDSLELARKAARTDCDVIVLCGVHFMAETATILSPEKIVLLPNSNAGCPMADTITADQLRKKKMDNPGIFVVSYVNTSAEVKAESDICCTSANALEIVKSIPKDRKVLFAPDRNLGAYVAKHSGRDLLLWEGCCPTHDLVKVYEIMECKNEHPEALILAHPECRPEIIDLADFVGSTARLICFAKQSTAEQFIIVTEVGIMHQLQKQCPNKKFHIASSKLDCRNMKAINLEMIKTCLEELEPRIKVDSIIREGAKNALERMLTIK